MTWFHLPSTYLEGLFYSITQNPYHVFKGCNQFDIYYSSTRKDELFLEGSSFFSSSDIFSPKLQISIMNLLRELNTKYFYRKTSHLWGSQDHEKLISNHITLKNKNKSKSSETPEIQCMCHRLHMRMKTFEITHVYLKFTLPFLKGPDNGGKRHCNAEAAKLFWILWSSYSFFPTWLILSPEDLGGGGSEHAFRTASFWK